MIVSLQRGLSDIDEREMYWCVTYNGRRVKDLKADLKRRAILSNDTLDLSCKYQLGGGKPPEQTKKRDAERKKASRLKITDTQRREAKAARARCRAAGSKEQKAALHAKNTSARLERRAALSREQKAASQAKDT